MKSVTLSSTTSLNYNKKIYCFTITDNLNTRPLKLFSKGIPFELFLPDFYCPILT